MTIGAFTISLVADVVLVGASGSAGVVLEDTNAGDWEMYNASGVLYFEDRGNTALALTSFALFTA